MGGGCFVDNLVNLKWNAVDYDIPRIHPPLPNKDIPDTPWDCHICLH